MEVNFLEAISQYGIVGAGFLYMLYQSHHREKQLMTFISNINDEFTKVSSALTTLAEDLRDVRRNSVDNAKRLEENTKNIEELAKKIEK